MKPLNSKGMYCYLIALSFFISGCSSTAVKSGFQKAKSSIGIPDFKGDRATTPEYLKSLIDFRTGIFNLTGNKFDEEITQAVLDMSGASEKGCLYNNYCNSDSTFQINTANKDFLMTFKKPKYPEKLYAYLDKLLGKDGYEKYDTSKYVIDSGVLMQITIPSDNLQKVLDVVYSFVKKNRIPKYYSADKLTEQDLKNAEIKVEIIEKQKEAKKPANKKLDENEMSPSIIAKFGDTLNTISNLFDRLAKL